VSGVDIIINLSVNNNVRVVLILIKIIKIPQALSTLLTGGDNSLLACFLAKFPTGSKENLPFPVHLQKIK
jgi:hypothetical protein